MDGTQDYYETPCTDYSDYALSLPGIQSECVMDVTPTDSRACQAICQNPIGMSSILLSVYCITVSKFSVHQ